MKQSYGRIVIDVDLYQLLLQVVVIVAGINQIHNARIIYEHIHTAKFIFNLLNERANVLFFSYITLDCVYFWDGGFNPRKFFQISPRDDYCIMVIQEFHGQGKANARTPTRNKHNLIGLYHLII